jgi:hypothetical protein
VHLAQIAAWLNACAPCVTNRSQSSQRISGTRQSSVWIGFSASATVKQTKPGGFFALAQLGLVTSLFRMKTKPLSRAALGLWVWVALAASGATQSAYDQWIDSFRGLSVWERAPGADPDADGYANAAEQLLGLNPTIPLGSDPRRANAPALFLQGRSWLFGYRVNAAANASGEFTHGIQRSLDLKAWLPVTPQISGDLYSTLVDFNPARHFYRAAISHQARGAIVPLPTFGARS